MANLLTDSEVARVRYHLGYPNTSAGAGIGLSMPTIITTLYPVDGALRNLYPEAVEIVRTLIARCDTAECNIEESEERLSALRVDSITLNDREPERREERYQYWVRRLSEATGCPINYMSGQKGGCNFARRGQ
jgi:hypothetical protein